jgi:hypothetical protein
MTQTASANCVHHWVLSLPEDDVVKGRCKRCGATRDYPASVEGASREGIYDEAASLGRSISLLPEGGRSGLQGVSRKW